MKKNQTIETQLDCHAVASLQEQINADLRYEDKSLSELLKKEEDNQTDGEDTKRD
jgi:hypothetical protein